MITRNIYTGTVSADLEYADLRDINLEYADLRDINLEYVNSIDTNLEGANSIFKEGKNETFNT